MKKIFKKNMVTQIGILTSNIETSKKSWEKFLNCEEKPVSESYGYEITGAVYKGKPMNGRIRQVCFTFENGIEVELIQPLGDEPSYWKECLEKNGPGIHHIAMAVKDIDACIEECETQGMVLMQKGSWPREEWPGGSYAYMDGLDSLNIILELLEKEEEEL